MLNSQVMKTVGSVVYSHREQKGGGRGCRGY